MKIEESMIIEKRDLDFILSMFLRQYLFNNRNTPPKSIVIPTIPEYKNFQDGSIIPIKFVDYIPDTTIVEAEEAMLTPIAEEAPFQPVELSAEDKANLPLEDTKAEAAEAERQAKEDADAGIGTGEATLQKGDFD